MSSDDFLSPLPGVRDGEPVNEQVTNRSLAAVWARLQNLNNRLDAIQAGVNLRLTNQPVSSSLLVGQPCYFNDELQAYAPAIFGFLSTESGLVLSASSLVRGILLSRDSANRGTILLRGYANVDLGQAVATSERAAYSNYGLGSIAAGRLQKDATGVSVLSTGRQVGGSVYEVFVDIRAEDLNQSHRHYKLALVCLPAGEHTPPLLGNRHVISSPDPEVEGWLPASHPVFDGKAPAAAAYGYNLQKSPLAVIWPNINPANVYLEWNRGRNTEDLGAGVPLGLNGLCHVDSDGIWWMSDCYEDVPWPSTLDTSLPPTSISVGLSPECPRSTQMSLTLHAYYPAITAKSFVVQSLSAEPDGPLRVVCADTLEEKTTGHLLLQFLPDGVVTFDATAIEGVSLKRRGSRNFISGPSVSGVRSVSSNLQVESVDGADDNGFHRAQITLRLNNDFASREVGATLVQLNSADEFYFNGVSGYAFPAGRDSSIVFSISVPRTADFPEEINAKIRLLLLGTTAGAVGASVVSARYKRLIDPAVLLTGESLPSSFTPLSLSTAVTLASARDYFAAESAEFVVGAGDIVILELTRTASLAYSGDIAVIKQNLVFGSVPT